jgi:hypothetical protein
MHKPEAIVKPGTPKNFRRLESHELVSLGDYVADEHRGLEPWEGPSGFRADAFIKAMYRRVQRRSTGTKH